MNGPPPRRGDLYLVDFERFSGSMGKPRPAVVVSIDSMNAYSMYVTVAALRSAAGKRRLPVHAFVPAGEGGLLKDSLVDAGHVATVDKAVLRQPIGRLGPQTMERVGTVLRYYLGL